MPQEDIRWVQSLHNFEKAMGHLESALKIENPDMIQKAGMIQFFEMSFELAWNMLKDYLEDQGFTDTRSPRGALKKAFEIGLIQNGHDWMDLLTDRNLTVHTYDEQKATDMEMLIKQHFFPLLLSLLKTFQVKAA